MINLDTSNTILIDVSSYMIHFSGIDSSSVFEETKSFIDMIISRFHKSRILFVFDGCPQNNSSEHEISYRKKKNEFLTNSMKITNDIISYIDSINLSFFFDLNFSSHDAISSISDNLINESDHIYIISKDFILFQICDYKKTFLKFKGSDFVISEVDRLDFFKEHGLYPEKIPFYLSFSGSNSDGIPGVSGISKKLSLFIVNRFDILDNVFDNKDKLNEYISSKYIFKKIVDNEFIAKRSYSLSKIKSKKISFSISNINKNNSLSLSSPLVEKDLRKEGLSFSIINTEEDFLVFSLSLLNEKILSVNLDEKLNQTKNKYKPHNYNGISISTKSTNCYIPFSENGNGLSFDYIAQKMKPALEDSKVKVIGFNLKKEIGLFSNYGVNIFNSSSLQVYAKLVDGLSCNSFSDLAFNSVLTKTSRNLNNFTNKSNSFDIKTAQDCSEVSSLLILIYNKLKDIIPLEDSNSLIAKVDNKLPMVLSHIEKEGFLVDKELLKENVLEAINIKRSIEYDVLKISNSSSSLDLTSEIRAGQYNKEEKPLLVSRYLKIISFLKTSFKILSFDEKGKDTNFKAFTSYSQTISKTGRIISSDLNFQSIPVNSFDKISLRECFISDKSFKIVSVDYFQFELFILANFSKDELLISDLKSGIDIHKKTASEIFGVSLELVTDNMRRISKSINFGVIYGKTAFSLSLEMNIEEEDAQRYIDIYFSRYQGVKKYINNIKKEARKNNYIKTLLGRKIHYPLISSSNYSESLRAENQCVNAVMQGSASDIIRKSMVDIYNWILKSKKSDDISIIMQVHDELIFKIRNDCVYDCLSEISKIMENAIVLDIPLTTSKKIGNNWLEVSSQI